MACNRNEASFTVLHVLFRILQPKPDQVTGDASLPPPKHWPIKFSESCGVGNRRIEGTAKCFEYGTRLTDAVFQSASESRPGIACVRFLSRANKSERKKEGERERERERREKDKKQKRGEPNRGKWVASDVTADPKSLRSSSSSTASPSFSFLPRLSFLPYSPAASVVR